MLKELGQLAGLMKNMGKLKEEAERFKNRLGELNAEGAAGGDMVIVRVNGHLEMLKVTLTPAAFEMADREMLEFVREMPTPRRLSSAQVETVADYVRAVEARGH